MNIAVIQKAVEMIKSMSDLCQKVIDAGNPEKYAASVNELNQGVSDTFAEMRNIIANDPQLNTDEKLARLQELAIKEEETKKRCGEAIQGNREHVAKVILEVFAGLLTCGISFAPGIVKGVKTALVEKKKLPLLEADQLVDAGSSDVTML